ncbi:MAG: C_GCAxxG_C_C family protein [Oscillospiraceae bacterium]|nr:C_GCAxxG_C_C family protein [Oscillospiraceae bacterium]
MTADREKVAELHARGFNCAQVVAYMCCELTGISEETSLAAMGGFGGGLRCGEVCGAVSGAIYTLGLLYPYTNGGDKEAKSKIMELTKLFTASFEEEFCALPCRELLAAGGKSLCENYMARAIELVHEIIEGDTKK